MIRAIITITFLWAISFIASAHLSGFTDTSIQIAKPGVKIIYTLPSDNLLELIPGNTEITPPATYMSSVVNGWGVFANKRTCFLFNSTAKALPKIASYQYVLSYECPQGMDELSIRYALFTEQWRGHQNYSRIFMADNKLRMRFAFDKKELVIPIKQLLNEWGKPLTTSFLSSDPHRQLQVEGWGDLLSKNIDDIVEQNVVKEKVSDKSSYAFSINNSNLSSIESSFIWIGITHIWQGLDHVLFIICLLLIPCAFKQLLLWVTSFTLAHSITLALSVLGVVSISPSITEPLIAVTVIMLGLENIYYLYRQPNNKLTIEKRYRNRWWVIFCFGLIHGIGFSYLLQELSSGEGIWGRLLMFNLGVELGQIAIIALLLLPVYAMFKWKHGLKMGVISSLLTSLIGTVWFIQRI
ncbi:HupE/UreJ family protein [Spartinivicinus ruber]|uniref:HupE/UreJ family protein n=1 Tax=Spartinivicinus ruber TaxID=2683272 RepID=UPI0013D33957|nr:HupE/UreJ family protein [Spartinivicinus ruber]